MAQEPPVVRCGGGSPEKAVIGGRRILLHVYPPPLRPPNPPAYTPTLTEQPDMTPLASAEPHVAQMHPCCSHSSLASVWVHLIHFLIQGIPQSCLQLSLAFLNRPNPCGVVYCAVVCGGVVCCDVVWCVVWCASAPASLQTLVVFSRIMSL